MRKLVLNTLEKYCMLDGVTEVTVALSGGADSMALLHILNSLKEQIGIKLFAAHLNHCLRGDDADNDEKTVTEFCKNLGIPLFCERTDVKLLSENSKDSVETVARNVRYEFLKRVSHGVIATAHTASDNLETVIFNTVRGSGIRGVCGIPPKRDNIIRPLIECTRADVENYCKQNNLAFCTDKTNFDDTYSRNNIRLNVVPMLKKINGNAEKNVARMSEILRADESYLSSVAIAEYKNVLKDNIIDVSKLNSYHNAIKHRIIKLFCEKITNETPEFYHIKEVEGICLRKRGSVNLKNNFIAKYQENKLIIIKAEKDSANIFPHDDFIFPENFKEVSYKDYKFSNKKFEEIVNFNKLMFQNAIDYDTILGNLKIRNRMAGDKITLSKRKVTKSLKKLFCEQKTLNRDSLLVVADDRGVVWVEGFGTDFKNRVTENTKNILTIEKAGK